MILVLTNDIVSFEQLGPDIPLSMSYENKNCWSVA